MKNKIIFIQLTLLLLAITNGYSQSTNSQSNNQTKMETKKMTNKEIVLNYYEEIGKGNYDAYDKYCTEDFEDIASHGQMKGLQNAKQASTGMHSCFSNIQFKIEDSMSEGNRVAVRGFISGTQIAPFFGMPNNGKSFNISFIAIYHLNESGKITHRFVNGDDQGMAKQLGWF